jgi:hypothetical protein
MSRFPSRQACADAIRQHEQNEEAISRQSSLYRMTGLPTQPEGKYDATNWDIESNMSGPMLPPASHNSLRYEDAYLHSPSIHSCTHIHSMGYRPSHHGTTSSTRYPLVPGPPGSSIYAPNEGNPVLNEESSYQRSSIINSSANSYMDMAVDASEDINSTIIASTSCQNYNVQDSSVSRFSP